MAQPSGCGDYVKLFFTEMPMTCGLLKKPFAEYPAGYKGLLSCKQEDPKAALSAWILYCFRLALINVFLQVVYVILYGIAYPEYMGLIIAGYMGTIIMSVIQAYLQVHFNHFWLIRHDACCCGGPSNPVIWLILGVLSLIGGVNGIFQTLSYLTPAYLPWSLVALIGSVINAVPLIYIGVLEIGIWKSLKGGAKVAPGAVGA